jgi:hypothetical protein
MFLPCAECYFAGITQYIKFSGWDFLLSNMLPKPFRVFLWLGRSFLFLLNNILFMDVTLCHFSYEKTSLWFPDYANYGQNKLFGMLDGKENKHRYIFKPKI